MDHNAIIEIRLEIEDDESRGRTQNRQNRANSDGKAESLSPRRSSFQSIFGPSANNKQTSSSLSPRGGRGRANTTSAEQPSPPLWSQPTTDDGSVLKKEKNNEPNSTHQNKNENLGSGAVPGVSDILVNSTEMPLNQKLTVLFNLKNIGAFGDVQSKASKSLFAITKARVLTQRHDTPVESSVAPNMKAEDIVKQAQAVNYEVGISAAALLDQSEKTWKITYKDHSIKFDEGPLGMGIFMHKEDNEICVTKLSGQAVTVGAHLGDEIVKVGDGM